MARSCNRQWQTTAGSQFPNKLHTCGQPMNHPGDCFCACGAKLERCLPSTGMATSAEVPTRKPSEILPDRAARSDLLHDLPENR